MRKPILCCLFFICLLPIVRAQELPKPNDDQAAVQNSPTGGDFFGFKIRPVRPKAEVTQTFCAYIRAYRVRREYRNSDIVIPAGYTTCVPTSRFEFRSAVVTQTEAVDGK